MTSPTSGSVERLDDVLKLLDIVRADEKNETEQLLTQEAIRAVTKLQCALKRSQLQLEQVAQLVRSHKWSKAMEAMRTNQINFPAMRFIPERFLPKNARSSERVVNKVLALIGNDKENLISGIGWVEYLDADLQPLACDTLYNSIMLRGFTDQPVMVLLLLKHIRNLPVGILDDVRTQLQIFSRSIIDRFVEAIKQNDYEAYSNEFGVFDFYMPAIVSQFDIQNVDSVLLLIKYNCYQIKFDTYYFHNNISLALVSTIFKALEENLLLESEQAMHLYTHAKCIHNLGSNDGIKFTELFTNARKKLTILKTSYFVHYQRYVEDQDKQKLNELHNKNPHLEQITNDFVTWYYNGDSKRTKNLYAVARIVEDVATKVGIMYQLYMDMVRKKQKDTFDAFFLFNELNVQGQLLEEHAPACVHLLLKSSSDAKQLRLVNKFLDAKLCVLEKRILCCNSDDEDEHLCIATVEPDTALTTFSFKSAGDDTCWQLDASEHPEGVVKVEEKGTKWMIKAVDEDYVKIFTEDDMFLTAGEPCYDNNLRWSVGVQKETQNEMQMWRIESL